MEIEVTKKIIITPEDTEEIRMLVEECIDEECNRKKYVYAIEARVKDIASKAFKEGQKHGN